MSPIFTLQSWPHERHFSWNFFNVVNNIGILTRSEYLEIVLHRAHACEPSLSPGITWRFHELTSVEWNFYKCFLLHSSEVIGTKLRRYTRMRSSPKNRRITRNKWSSVIILAYIDLSTFRYIPKKRTRSCVPQNSNLSWNNVLSKCQRVAIFK